MNRQLVTRHLVTLLPALLIAAWPVLGGAQVAVADIEEIEEFTTLSATEIEEIVSPIALYPDDLLAIVLPASTFPLQVVEAGRFLEDLEDDPSLEPDPDWDDSIVALLNYPEVVAMMNDDLDWTWRLGEAVVSQQSDVIAAVETFRDRAYAAGNLKSDEYQLVAEEEGAISITPVEDDVIYVPYYEPEQVVIYQPRPVYFYYPRAYPVYYYPYPTHYAFHDHFRYPWFWGVTTAFSIGWHSHHLSVFHHSFYGHPYYGHTYRDYWWYRRPDIHVHNNIYVRNNVNTSYNRYRSGDHWAPSERRTVRSSDQRITRTRYYAGTNTNSRPVSNTKSYSPDNRSGQVTRSTRLARKELDQRRVSEPEPIQFRNRPEQPAARASRPATSKITTSRSERPKASSGRSSEPRIATPGRSQPKVTSSQRSSEPRINASRPSQPRVSSPRPAEPRVTTPRPAQPRVSSPAPSRSAQRPSSPSRSASRPTSRPSASRANSSNSRSKRREK